MIEFDSTTAPFRMSATFEWAARSVPTIFSQFAKKATYFSPPSRLCIWKKFPQYELGIAEVATGTPETSLLYGHFEGVRRFAAVAGEAGAVVGDGPYEEDRAAVHHVLDEGWMYVLRFDPERDGRALASVGIVLRREAAEGIAGLAPAAAFETVLRRYPTLAGCFEGATAVRPVARVERLAYRRERAWGRRWLMLPHSFAFLDPMFSTGMAWSLVAVERAAALLSDGMPPAPAALERYGRLLAAEADHLGNLVAGAWAAMPSFPHLVAQAQLYFAAASFQEAKQRLTGGDHAWDGFLGATDPRLAGAVAAARERLEAGREDAAAFAAWVAGAIAPRNVAGLADPARRNLYPVDLEALVAAAPLLGLSREEVRDALPRLRGGGEWRRAPVLSS